MSKFWWQVAGFFLVALLTVTQLRPVLGVEWYGKSEWYLAQSNPQSVGNYPCDNLSVNATGKIPPDVPKTEEEKKQFELANPPNPGLVTYNYLYRSGDVPDAPRLARVYGGKPEEWNEHRTPGFTVKEHKVYLRWFRNRYSVVDYEYKFVAECGQGKGSKAECIAKAVKWKSGKKNLSKQVDGIQHLLDAMDKAGVNKAEEQAEVLANANQETSGFDSLHEKGGNEYFTENYDPGTEGGKNVGNTQKGDGTKYHGRGYVHVTGRYNYGRYGQDFLNNPDLMADPDTAAQITAEGMRDGKFRGDKLDDFYNQDGTYDYEGARNIINGDAGKPLDKHQKNLGTIGQYIDKTARKIEKAINDCN